MSANQFKKYMNDVYLIDGMNTGWITRDELEISLVFLDKQVNVVFEAMENLEELLETEFWYD